jgi:hypothetical protein
MQSIDVQKHARKLPAALFAAVTASDGLRD